MSGKGLALTRVSDGEYTLLNFSVDIPADAYYYDAALWAAENGITKVTNNTTFSPGASCTRAQIVTFLYRYFMK